MSDSDSGNEVQPPPRKTESLFIAPPPRIVPGANEIPPIAPDSAVCLQCGYSLRGLDTTRNCPECGAPIRRSLMGNLLEFSSPEYVLTLHRGVLLVLVAMIGQLAVGLLSMIGAIVLLTVVASATANAPFGGANFELWLSVIVLPFSVLLLLGWWMFSAPDPAILGTEKGQTPRMIIRITVVIHAVISIAHLLIISTSHPAFGSNFTKLAAGMIANIVGIVQFFASVLYVRWLAPRIPDLALYEKAQKYLWQLPLIYILGAICFMLGPLIATIMYLIMLNTVRARLRAILDLQARP